MVVEKKKSFIATGIITGQGLQTMVRIWRAQSEFLLGCERGGIRGIVLFVFIVSS